MSEHAPLPPEALLLIEFMAKSIAGWMITQLQQSSRTAYQYTDNAKLMQGRSTGKVFNQIVDNMFDRPSVDEVSLRPTIIVDIASCGKSNNPLVNAFVRTNFSLVPTRLIQRADRLVSKEASNAFAEELTKTVKTIVFQDIKDVGEAQCFGREQELHRTKHKMGKTDPCCIFKLLEEDYMMPYDLSKQKYDTPDPKDEKTYETGHYFKSLYQDTHWDKVKKDYVLPNRTSPEHDVADFCIKCEFCGGHHDFKVVR